MLFFYMIILLQGVGSGMGVVFNGSKYGKNSTSEEESIGNQESTNSIIDLIRSCSYSNWGPCQKYSMIGYIITHFCPTEEERREKYYFF